MSNLPAWYHINRLVEITRGEASPATAIGCQLLPMRFHVDARVLPGADIQPRLVDEQRRIGNRIANGSSSNSARRTDGTGAWLIVSAPDEAFSQRQLATLPFVEIGITTIDPTQVEPVEIDQP